MVRLCYILSLTLLCIVALASAADARRMALVIGNSGYTHAPALPNPENDARAIATAFSGLGYQVELVENASRSDMLDVLRRFRARSLGAEQSVIYYAGHGIEIDRQNFVVPVDAELKADIDVEYEAVPLELLVAATSGATGLQLVVLDACRDNPFLSQMTRTLSTRSIGRGLALYEPDGNSLVAYAAREGTVALDGTGRNSPYAKAFLSSLDEPGLEIGQFFRKVRDAVVRETNGQQEPFLYGSLSAEPVFFKPTSSAPAVAQQPSVTPRPDTSASADTLLAIDLAFWQSIRDSAAASDFEDYLNRFPDGQFRPLAQRRLAALQPRDEAARSSAAPAPADPAPLSPPAAVVTPTAPASQQPQVAATPQGGVTLLPVPLRLSREETRDLQARLNILGFDAGPEDGIEGRRTRAAVSAYWASRAMTGEPQIDSILLARLAADVPEARLIAYREERQKEQPSVAQRTQPQTQTKKPTKTQTKPSTKTAAKQPAKKKPAAASSGNLSGFVGRSYCRSKNGKVLNGRNLSDRPIWCVTVLSLNNSQIRYRISQRDLASKPISTSVFTRARTGNRTYGPVKLASSGSGSLFANGATFVASQIYR